MTADRFTLDYSALGPKFWEGDKPKIDNISGAARTNAHLWTASDEGSTIERLSPTAGGFGEARQFELADYFDWLEAGKEVDIEALAWDGERLWICGSHAIKRTQLGGAPDEVKAPRTLLGYLVMENGEPQAGVCLPRKEKKGSLLWAIEKEGGELNDAIFEKGDGLDIEGFAVNGGDALVGLRRPLLSNHAALVRLSFTLDADEFAIQKAGGAWGRLHKLDLGGLAVRDLLRIGDDALISAGPQESVDGPYALYVWRGAFAGGKDAEVRKLMDLPVRPNVKPEAMALLEDGRILIINDGPQQIAGRAGVIEADAYDIAL